MTAHPQSGEENLTGVWHGLYTYSNGLSVSFVATLIEIPGLLSGSIEEPCMTGQCPSDTIHAALAGRRQASAVTFVKTYEQAGLGYENPVAYDGAISSDATEIEGRWSIPGSLSGKFLMIRSVGKAVAAEQKVSERVRG
jgi:hypothetical protein